MLNYLTTITQTNAACQPAIIGDVESPKKTNDTRRSEKESQKPDKSGSATHFQFLILDPISISIQLLDTNKGV